MVDREGHHADDGHIDLDGRSGPLMTLLQTTRPLLAAPMLLSVGCMLNTGAAVDTSTSSPARANKDDDVAHRA